MIEINATVQKNVVQSNTNQNQVEALVRNNPVSAAAHEISVAVETVQPTIHVEMQALGSGAGIDHGTLAGLSDDDHPQYLTQARGDLRYYTQAQIGILLTAKEDVGVAAGLVLAHEEAYNHLLIATALQSGNNVSELVNDSGYLTEETDPVFSSSAAFGIESGDITNWDTAYGWGNHAAVGYLTAETDPVFLAWLLATPPLYEETDPVWASEKTDYVPKSGATMTGPLLGFFYAATKAELQATVPDSMALGWATDTRKLYLYDDSDWRVADLPMEISGYDMGYETDSPRTGYHKDWISNKRLHNISLGTNPMTGTEYGIWVDNTTSPVTLKFYANSTTNTIIYDLTTQYNDFRHTPFDVDTQYKVWSGMTVIVGLNGRPIGNEYSRDIGAFPSARTI